MNRLLNIVLIILCFVLLWSYAQARQDVELYKILGIPKQGPRAVLTIQYGEAPTGFAVGDFYVLKVLRVGDTFVDYGFSQIQVERGE